MKIISNVVEFPLDLQNLLEGISSAFGHFIFGLNFYRFYPQILVARVTIFSDTATKFKNKNFILFRHYFVMVKITIDFYPNPPLNVDGEPEGDPEETDDFNDIYQFEKWLQQKFLPKYNDLNSHIFATNGTLIECVAVFSNINQIEKAYLINSKLPFMSNLPEESNLPDDLRKKLEKNICTHTHLSEDSTFSRVDLNLWLTKRIKEIRAVTESKIFSIKVINDNWPNIESLNEFLKDPSLDSDSTKRDCILSGLSNEGFFEYSIEKTGSLI
ncbi:hypothetical protein [Methanospirillum lacunae]|uniref:Uncharacterized protein n=1 Tax=Methanospirillum lacunae TaxID=668570 RepID=A0A2V2NEA3_9EURY|nr:hypothetical protein [Methanospirillum lacunae]PWR73931.1 hypothetical protein DK846_01840 [Methanospirillum lacunae]